MEAAVGSSIFSRTDAFDILDADDMCSIHRGWARRFGTGSYWWDRVDQPVFRTVKDILADCFLFGIVGEIVFFIEIS